ncbi:hypothetical protein QL093DRAFT_2517744 [Fusarium oxysporum]|nr:hypothetical protein QL093DRAFT_2517744 [Fusarium oxysporum]
MGFIAGNPAQPSDNGASTSGVLIPFLVVFSFILGVPFLFIIVHLVRLLRRNRHPQRDVESTNTIPRETVDLRSLNDANPSQKYKRVEEVKRQGTWNSTQTSLAEVWCVCKRCNFPHDTDVFAMQSASKS